MGRFHQRSTNLPFGQFLFPVSMSLMVDAFETPQSFDQFINCCRWLFRFYGFGQFVRNEVALNDKFRWWKDVGEHILHFHNLPIERAIHFGDGKSSIRPDSVTNQTCRKNSNQEIEPDWDCHVVKPHGVALKILNCLRIWY